MSDEPRRLTPTPYGRHLGLQVLGADRGIATVRLELAEHICNRRGVAHGGALASLLDSALGAAVISAIKPHEWCGTLQLSIQYSDPARRGPLLANGRVVRRGRTVAFAEGEVVDSSVCTVARSHGTWTIWPGHPDGKKSDG